MRGMAMVSAQQDSRYIIMLLAPRDNKGVKSRLDMEDDMRLKTALENCWHF